MSRFYVGQPVVCVKDDWSCNSYATCPVRGHRYVVVSHMENIFTGMMGIEVYGIPEWWWLETHFEPITENQVQAIIAQATDLPMEVEDA